MPTIGGATSVQDVVPPAALSRLELDTLTWARLFKIVRVDSEILRLTDHDRQITYREDDGTEYTYTPSSAPSTQARQSTAGIQKEVEEFSGFVLSSDDISHEDLRIGVYDHARVDVLTVDWRYPWVGKIDFQRYWLHDIAFSGEQWGAQLRSLAGQIDVKIGRKYNKYCDATLGDSRCGIDLSLSTWKETGATVTAVTSLAAGDHPRMRFESDITGRADKFFKDGVLVWTSGNNVISGKTEYVVKRFEETDGYFELYLPTVRNIEVGDTFNVTAGCDKRMHHHCRKQFNNIDNFRGFPWLPTSKRIIKSPNAEK